MRSSTDVDPDEVRTDLNPPDDVEWSKPIRVIARDRMFPITFTLNPHCSTCGQPMPKRS